MLAYEMLPVIFVIVILDISILNSIQWTKPLDEIWKKNKRHDEALTWQYIGTQTGVMRIYPGQSLRVICI